MYGSGLLISKQLQAGEKLLKNNFFRFLVGKISHRSQCDLLSLPNQLLAVAWAVTRQEFFVYVRVLKTGKGSYMKKQ